jgi:hypothetical protein
LTRPSVNLGHFRSPRFRTWRGKPLHPSEEAFMFFRDEGPVPETLLRLEAVLNGAGIPHIFIGAAALKVYGLRRTTEDVDMCMEPADLERFGREFVGSVYQPVQGRSRRFFDPATQTTIGVLVAGEVAGRREKQQSVRFPSPSEKHMIDELPVPNLERLIELKLVTWRHQDWADVITMIRHHHLDERFSAKLDPVVRSAYLQCYDDMIEEDRYNPEIHDRPPDETPP